MADPQPIHRLPDHGLDADQVLARMEGLKVDDRDWRGGRVFSLVYSAGDAVHDLLEQAATLYSAENALNTGVFPSLGRMQQDIVEPACPGVGSLRRRDTGFQDTLGVAVQGANFRRRRLAPGIRRGGGAERGLVLDLVD